MYVGSYLFAAIGFMLATGRKLLLTTKSFFYYYLCIEETIIMIIPLNSGGINLIKQLL